MFFSNSDLWRNSPRASPPTQCLDMIAEHHDEPNCPDHRAPLLSDVSTPILAQRPPPEPTPQISVTDDYGTTYIHRRNDVVTDPLTDFHQYANDLLCTQQQIIAPSALDNYYYSQPPPANLYSTTNNYEYCTRSDDGILALNSTRTMPDVCAQLKYVLDSLSDVTCENLDDLSLINGVNSAANNASRRVSLKSDDGTEIEIDVSSTEYQTGGVCRVEFRCVDGDINRYEMLCTQVLSGLSALGV